MQLSKLEHRAYEEFRSHNLAVFTPKEAQLLLRLTPTQTYNLLKALKRKQAIQKIGKKRYALAGTDEFRIATALHFPSYISFWSALSYYGFTDQLPRRIFLASSRYSQSIGPYTYVTLSRKRFFGYQLLGNITIAEKEKAMLDSLLLPKYAGGIKEIWKSFVAAQSKLEVQKLIKYAMKMESKILLRRLGFFLERLGTNSKMGLTRKKLAALQKNIGRGYEKLDPSLHRKNKFNKQWLLDVNVDYDFPR